MQAKFNSLTSRLDVDMVKMTSSVGLKYQVNSMHVTILYMLLVRFITAEMP